MAIIVVASTKGSPGVSLAVWGLVHCWPRPVVGLEADENGGCWALRHGLTSEPGLMSLAADRNPLTNELLSAHATDRGNDRAVVCAPTGGRQVTAALGWLTERLTATNLDVDVLIDAGRLRPSGPNGALVRRADGLVWFVRPNPEDIGPTADAIVETARLLRPSTAIHTVAVGTGSHSNAEVVDALQQLSGVTNTVRLVAELPDDPVAAGQIKTGARKADRIAWRWFGPLARELAAAVSYRPITSDSGMFDSGSNDAAQAGMVV